MARARRGSTPALIELLTREPYRFDSRQAVRILEARRRHDGGPDLRFRSSLSLAFPVGDIESVDVPSGPAGHPVMTVSFLGLGGASGPLPAPFTEFLNAAVRRHETSGRDFLDLFNHRLVAAAMDMAKLYRPALQPGAPQESNLARQCYALLGLDTPGAREAAGGIAPALLPLTALVNQRPMSAHAIERALAAHLGLPARVRQFRGEWLRLEASQRTAIGHRGRHNVLGRTATLGSRIWAQDARIAVDLGPMSPPAAEDLLPTAPAGRSTRHPPLAALIDFLVQGAVGVDVRLLVESPRILPSRLSRSRALRLGWSAWLTRDAAARHAPARLGRARLGVGEAGDGGPPRAVLQGVRMAPVTIVRLAAGRRGTRP